MKRLIASMSRSRPRANRWSRALVAWALAAGSALPAARAADRDAPPTAPALRMVQSGGTMMWVLDSPAPAAVASAPASTPVLETQLVNGQHLRVLRPPGSASVSGRATLVDNSVATSGAAMARVVPSEQVLPNGVRVLVLPPDPVSIPPVRPALVERIIDPSQPGTRPGDLPAVGTLYRVAPKP